MAALEDRPVRYDPAEIARAGVFVSIDSEGALRVERGFVRPEDEAPVELVEGGEPEGGGEVAVAGTEGAVQRAVITIGGAPASPDPEAAEEDETIRPLSDRLVTELTAHRTLALRDAVANDPHVAFQAVLHALCLQVFYRYAPTPAWRSRRSIRASAPRRRAWRTPRRPRRSRRDMPNGAGSCPRRRPTSGTLCRRSTPTARRRCSPTAPRLP